jgi:hypothetical protein
MKDFDRSFNRMHKFVSIFIGVVFFIIIGAWIVFGVISYKAIAAASEQDWSGGVKPVIEKLWCGTPGCIDGKVD